MGFVISTRQSLSWVPRECCYSDDVLMPKHGTWYFMLEKKMMGVSGA